MKVQVAAKEEVVERLIREKEQLASRVGLAEHQSALLKARLRGRGEGGEEEEEEEGGGEEWTELQSLKEECEALRTQ